MYDLTTASPKLRLELDRRIDEIIKFNDVTLSREDALIMVVDDANGARGSQWPFLEHLTARQAREAEWLEPPTEDEHALADAILSWAGISTMPLRVGLPLAPEAPLWPTRIPKTRLV